MASAVSPCAALGPAGHQAGDQPVEVGFDRQLQPVLGAGKILLAERVDGQHRRAKSARRPAPSSACGPRQRFIEIALRDQRQQQALLQRLVVGIEGKGAAGSRRWRCGYHCRLRRRGQQETRRRTCRCRPAGRIASQAPGHASDHGREARDIYDNASPAGDRRARKPTSIFARMLEILHTGTCLQPRQDLPSL